MLWFRVGEQITGCITFAFTFGILYNIINMMVIGANSKSMDESPTLNGTIGAYICIVILQLWIAFTCIFGFYIAFKVWKNNYQMDRRIRHWFIIWLGSWFGSLLTNVAVAIWALLRGKEPQDEMVFISESFTKNANDGKFVASFERYQRENNCCGIYGANDWLILQLRPAANAGGGGGGYRSLDYGFQANPSTGHCHMSHSQNPMGCGKKLLEEVHVKLSTNAGLMIVESVVGIIAGVLAWYCFFYWLEKEVIVIPEDEVSNLIVIEPESSTSTVIDNVYGSGGYLPPGGPHSAGYINDRKYGPSRIARSSYYSPGYVGRSRSYYHHTSGYNTSGSHNHHHPSGSHNHHPSGSHDHPAGSHDHPAGSHDHPSGSHDHHPAGSHNHHLSDSHNRQPSGSHNHHLSKSQDKQKPSQTHKKVFNTKTKQVFGSVNQSAVDTPIQTSKSSKKSTSNPAPAQKTSHKSKSKNKYTIDSYELNPKTQNKSLVAKSTVYKNRIPSITRTQKLLSAAGAFDANSRFRSKIESRPPYIEPHYQTKYIPPYHKNLPVTIVGSEPKAVYLAITPKHSHNHMLHKQELALGGKVLGEMHVDHAKDDDPMNPRTDAAKGEKGHREHHATVAIVRNKNTPKPKTFLPKQNKAVGHHGQTGHLAEDIVEMTGNKAKNLVDDIVLPVEHNPAPVLGHGGYLALHKKREPVVTPVHAEGIPDGVVHLARGNKISAPSVDGSQAQNILETIIAPRTAATKADTRDLPKAHYAGVASPRHGPYLPSGAPGQNRYLHAHPTGYLPMGIGGSREIGEHRNVHYLHLNRRNSNTRTIQHENSRYVLETRGEHEQGHYLPEHRGEHEQGHYIPEYRGEHERGHYLPEHRGEHERGHYLPEHRGEHEQGHYLPEHRREHERGNYIPEHQGEHERGHYLPEREGHERGHYLPQRGEHERGHYL